MKLHLSRAAFALLATCAAVAHADTAALIQRGKTLSYTCDGCHGIENYKNVYPTYSVPKLGGQHAAYLEAALKAYATGERAHSTMHAHAASLSDEDRKAIAAFFASQPRQPGRPVGTPPAATATCAACHGNDGVSVIDQNPILAGQHRDYLEQALRDYKTGKRKNPVMAGMIATVKDEDIPAIAAFFARQPAALCSTDQIRNKGKCP